MKAIRLNTSLRMDILDNIRKSWENANPCHNVADNCPSFDAELKALAWEAYAKLADIYFEAKKQFPNLTNLAPGNTYFTYYVATNEQSISVHESELPEGLTWVPLGKRHIANWNEPKNQPAAYKKLLTNKVKIVKAHRKEQEKVSAWVAERDAYMHKVAQVVQGVNTTKQLVEAWPEVSKFIPTGLVNPSKINLPAISIADLNSGLGIGG